MTEQEELLKDYQREIMTDEQLLNSLQGTMATIDPYSVKKEALEVFGDVNDD